MPHFLVVYSEERLYQAEKIIEAASQEEAERLADLEDRSELDFDLEEVTFTDFGVHKYR